MKLKELILQMQNSVILVYSCVSIKRNLLSRLITRYPHNSELSTNFQLSSFVLFVFRFFDYNSFSSLHWKHKYNEFFKNRILMKPVNFFSFVVFGFVFFLFFGLKFLNFFSVSIRRDFRHLPSRALLVKSK